MNVQKLKAVMVEHGDNQNDLAKALGFSTAAAVSTRFTGRTPFTQPEMETIALRYKLSAEDIQKIFFAQTSNQE